ncbi:hypothetical protein TRFO_30209 [Tritrichomonas foetus]|uniref:Meckelin n=1 Tax=Tritrichomonas foetus TaxID=1144522 RepID=A0A1J4JW47_9EUKA|nr:hypothetical protein TRFO_30209 [Tritrichomonas foetus]|eukprot:OHT02664.1 hypothetical protein TRFO_30209 [Tritrichomonas foetus]
MILQTNFHMLFVFIFVSRAADEVPLLHFDPQILTGNSYYNSWSYEYVRMCPQNLIRDGWQCSCGDLYLNATNQTCQSSCNETGYRAIEELHLCVNDSIYLDFSNTFRQTTTMKYFDIISGPDSEKQFMSDTPNHELIEQPIYENALICNFNKNNQTACNFLANMCSVSMYNADFEACRALNIIFPERRGNMNGYYDWPTNQPFLNYTDTLRNVMRENYVKSNFQNSEIISFQLAQYSYDGHFKGFRELKADLQKCSIKKNRKQIWRQFGWNFFSECNFNFSFAYDTTDFFDIFFQENYNSTEPLFGTSHPVLRPIPILLSNYRDQSNIDVNRQNDDTQYKLFRRFFMKDNYTRFERSPNIYQILSNINIVFTIRTSDKSSIQTPYIMLEYIQVANTSNFLPKFSFNVNYTMEMEQFWDAVLYVFIIFLLLVVAYWIIHSFVYLKQYNYGGNNIHNILAVASEFFISLGILLFGMCLAFGLFILWFYKWTKKIIMCLPPEEEFFIFFPIIWVSFGLLIVGVFLKVFLQSSLNFFFIDWENPRKKKISISAWRRILIGNEWSKISTVRVYSITFTLVTVLMILKGFNTILIATPIPSSELIDMKITYKILRFAYISFIWLLLFLVQYVFVNFIYWKIYGSPFHNFLEVLRVSKISCFLLITNNHGYYLHGKKNNISNADVDIETLNENLDMEDDTKDEIDQAKVFEIYLSTEFYHLLREKYYSLKIGFSRNDHLAPYESYKSINSFLREFIERNCLHKYLVQKWSRVQMIDMGPDISDNSIFTAAPDEQYKYSMMYGIQGVLMIFYLVLFCAIDVTTYSPEIGAFAVFIVDWIIYYIFKLRTRRSLSRKGILDPRFFIR